MRLLNRPLALVLALALVATGAIVTIEVIAFALNAKPVVVHWTAWLHWADTTRWNRAVVKVWAVILIAVGLLLLLLQLKPRRATRVSMTAQHGNTDAALTRKGLAGAVQAAVLDVDGIAKAHITAGRRSVRVAATSGARDTEAAKALTEPLTRAAQAQLDALGLQNPVRLRATVKGAKA